MQPLPAAGWITPVHPHGCGEHSLFDVVGKGHGGSSPRVWGTFLPVRSLPCRKRFIPTGVGNIGGTMTFLASLPVHPHGCGEHKITPPQALGRAGSSPRVWGTLASLTLIHVRHRFIPTGVGNMVARSAGLNR